MRINMAVVAAVSLCLHNGVALAQTKHPRSKLPIPSVTDFPASRIDWAYRAEALTPLSEYSRRHQGTASASVIAEDASAFATPVAALQINLALLDRPAEGRLGALGFGVPRHLAHLQLSIEGEQYILFVGDVTIDAAKKLRHITAAVLNRPGAYARFTVDDRAGIVVGTIHTSQVTYRIVPSAAGGQLVYRLHRRADEDPRWSRTLLDAAASPAIRSAEARHRTVELLGEIQPWHVNFSTNEFMLTLVGGNIGKLDPDAVTSDDIRKLLVRLAPLARASGTENYEITAVTPRDEEVNGARSIGFRQTINGIPVDFDQEIVVGEDGQIKRLTIALVDPDAVTITNRITREAATDAASMTLGKALASGPRRQQTVSSELRYAHVNGDWSPVWRFLIDVAGAGSYFVDVDGVGGVAKWWSADRRITGDDFRTRVYGATSGSPDHGSSPGASLICQESNDADVECGGQLPKYEWVELIISKTNYEWELARGSDAYLCCSGIGAPPSETGPLVFQDEFLDVIIDTPAALEGGFNLRYRSSTQSLLFPPPTPAYPGEYSKSMDVVVHETMHGYTHRANRSFFADPNDISGALNEGMADAMAGIMSVIAQGGWEQGWFGAGNPATGAAWVIGDSPAAPFPVEEQRNLTDSTINWSHFEVPSPDIHSRGQAIGAFFYRVWMKNSISSRRMVELMLQVTKLIRDPNNNGYDLQDFYNALIDSVKPGESALLVAINEAWDEMTPASNQPPGSRPLPPPYVAGAPYGCVSGYSMYTVSWPSVSNADGYGVYSSQGGGYHYLGSDSDNITYYWTQVNSWVKASAFNEYGESALSPVSFPAPNTLCY